MTLRQLVVSSLRAQGFDGLRNADGECACPAEDLAPCGHPNLDCEPGYRSPCDCGDHDFHIGPGKPAAHVCSCGREFRTHQGLGLHFNHVKRRGGKHA